MFPVPASFSGTTSLRWHIAERRMVRWAGIEVLPGNPADEPSKATAERHEAQKTPGVGSRDDVKERKVLRNEAEEVLKEFDRRKGEFAPSIESWRVNVEKAVEALNSNDIPGGNNALEEALAALKRRMNPEVELVQQSGVSRKVLIEGSRFRFNFKGETAVREWSSSEMPCVFTILHVQDNTSQGAGKFFTLLTPKRRTIEVHSSELRDNMREWNTRLTYVPSVGATQVQLYDHEPTERGASKTFTVDPKNPPFFPVLKRSGYQAEHVLVDAPIGAPRDGTFPAWITLKDAKRIPQGTVGVLASEAELRKCTSTIEKCMVELQMMQEPAARTKLHAVFPVLQDAVARLVLGQESLYDRSLQRILPHISADESGIPDVLLVDESHILGLSAQDFGYWLARVKESAAHVATQAERPKKFMLSGAPHSFVPLASLP